MLLLLKFCDFSLWTVFIFLTDFNSNCIFKKSFQIIFYYVNALSQCPGRIHPGEFPCEKSLNFLPPRYILHYLVHSGGSDEWLIFPGDFVRLILMSFDIITMVSLRQSLVSARVLSGSQQSTVTFLPKYQAKFLGYDRLVFSRFDQLCIVSWETSA